jgi:hypothetical protein
MNKEAAFELAAAGKKIKREGWPAGKYLYVKDGRKIVHEENAEDSFYKLEDSNEGGKKVVNPDRHATDWKIYEDEIPAPSKQFSTFNENDKDGSIKLSKDNLTASVPLSATFVNKKNEATRQTM